ncbi:hypothetical protein ALQ47_05294 [Pseudomonas cichorii]|nr:hypothetical protein ALQ47_05294 [Pseudomonas cichorii]
MQDTKRQCADHHHVANAHCPASPEQNGPGEHGPRHARQTQVMQHPGLFHIHPAPALSPCLGADFRIQPLALSLPRREGLDRPDIVDQIHKLTTHTGRLRRIKLMTTAPANAEEGDDRRHQQHERHQCQRHLDTHCGQHHHSPQKVDAGRNDFPQQRTVNLPRRRTGSRNATAQGSGVVLGKVAHRVPGQMAEQVHAHVRTTGNHRATAQPAAQAPEQVLDSDQKNEKAEGEPDPGAIALVSHTVDQQLHAVLYGHRATGGGNYQRDHTAIGPCTTPDVAPQKAPGSGVGRHTLRNVHADGLLAIRT